MIPMASARSSALEPVRRCDEKSTLPVDGRTVRFSRSHPVSRAIQSIAIDISLISPRERKISDAARDERGNTGVLAREARFRLLEVGGRWIRIRPELVPENKPAQIGR